MDEDIGKKLNIYFAFLILSFKPISADSIIARILEARVQNIIFM